MPRRWNALVVDDDPGVAAIVASLVDEGEVAVESAATSRAGFAKLQASSIDVLVLDQRLPDGTGLDFLARARALDPRLPALFVTAEGSSANAIEAMKLGAFDFLSKPLDLDRLERQLAAALEHRRLMRAPVELAPEGSTRSGADELVGRCPAMQEVFRAIGRVASQPLPALIVGETGVGKELVARAIYQHGDRADRLFLKVDCSDFSDERLEIELFGAEDAAGAVSRVGKLEQCRDGTLLLEGVDSLSSAIQSKLLRVLRHGQFERVGGATVVRTDVRLLFAATGDPEESLRSGRLRPDMYYALRAYLLRIPPLRERGDDLRLLTERFVARLGNFGRGVANNLPRVSPEAFTLLENYPWPGNVAELESVLRRALVESKGAVLATDFLRSALRLRNPSPIEESLPAREPRSFTRSSSSDGGWSDDGARTDWRSFVEARLNSGAETLYEEAVEEMERHVIVLVLSATGGNQAKAARALGMTRTSLRKKVHALGIRLGPYVASQGACE